jgi:hypothetical protein
MKRKLLIPAMLLLLGAADTFGQNVLEKGTTYVDAYYGFPNLITSALRSANNNSGSTNVTVKGIGPLGGRVMYMLGEKVGLGIDFNYANSSVSWNKIDSANGKIYYYKASLPRFRIMASFEYHIRQTSNFDFYYMLRMGYGQWSPTFETNDPNASAGKVNWSVPFAFRTGLGARYYFTKYFGANIDVGFFGGGAVQAGLSTKF